MLMETIANVAGIVTRSLRNLTIGNGTRHDYYSVPVPVESYALPLEIPDDDYILRGPHIPAQDLDEPPSPLDLPRSLVPYANSVSSSSSDTLLDTPDEEFEEGNPEPAISLTIDGLPVNEAFLSLSPDGTISLNLVNALRQSIEIETGDLDIEIFNLQVHRERVRLEAEELRQERLNLQRELQLIDEQDRTINEQAENIERTYQRILTLPEVGPNLSRFLESDFFRRLSREAQQAVLQSLGTPVVHTTPATSLTPNPAPNRSPIQERGELNFDWPELGPAQLEAWDTEFRHLREPDAHETAWSRIQELLYKADHYCCHWHYQQDEIGRVEPHISESCASFVLGGPEAIIPPKQQSNNPANPSTSSSTPQAPPSSNTTPGPSTSTAQVPATNTTNQPMSQQTVSTTQSQNPSGSNPSTMSSTTTSDDSTSLKMFVFKGEKFDQWKIGMEALLSAKNLWNATKDLPWNNASDDTNKAKTSKACSIIIMHIDDSQWIKYANKTTYPSGEEIWTDLTNNYGTSTVLAAIQHYTSLASYSISEGDDYNDAFNSMDNLHQRVQAGKITVDELTYSVFMLNALPPSWKLFRTTLLTSLKDVSTDLKPNLVRTRVQLEMDSRTKSRSIAHVSQSTNCHNCNSPGHWAKDCPRRSSGSSSRNHVPAFSPSSSSRPRSQSRPPTPQKKSFSSPSPSSSNSRRPAFKGSRGKPPRNKANVASSSPSNESSMFLYGGARDKSKTDSHSIKWIIDSGCTDHITPVRSDFNDQRYEAMAIPSKIYIADGEYMEAQGLGSCNFETYHSGTWKPIEIRHALFVPSASTRLLSVSKLDADGFKVEFNESKCVIRHRETNTIIARGRQEERLYVIEFRPAPKALSAKTTSVPFETWHKRLGHMGVTGLKSLIHSEGLPVTKGTIPSGPKDFKCEACLGGKQHRISFRTSDSRASKRLELIHSELMGPMQTESLGHSLYTLSFLDDYSELGKMYFLPNKEGSTVLKYLTDYVEWAENHTGEKVKTIRTDGGKEYVNRECQAYLSSKGITHQVTNPKTPEENGRAERYNRTIMETARAMRLDSGLPPTFWAEASYVHVPNDERRKLDAKSVKTVFIGMDETSKSGKFWNANRCSMMRSRTFTCDEQSFPMRRQYNVNELEEDDFIITQPQPVTPPTPSTPLPTPLFSTVVKKNIQPLHATPTLVGAFPLDDIAEEEEDLAPIPFPELNRSDDEVEELLEAASSTQDLEETVTTTSKKGKGKVSQTQWSPTKVRPKRDAKAVNKLIVKHDKSKAYNGVSLLTRAFALKGAETSSDPISYRDAMGQTDADAWKQAARAEYESLIKNKTWDLVERPSNKKILKARWVWKLKHDANGKPVKYKARFCVKGFEQVPGVDYDETFAPVARYETIRTLLALACANNWHVHQMDVKTAFLNGDIDEEIFIEQPEGFAKKGQENKVCRLKKALYGLKQAPRQWNIKIHNTLTDLGFKITNSDPGLYVYHRQSEGEKEPMYVVLYVDDVTLFSPNLKLLQKIEATLEKTFDMTNEGDIAYYLGIRIWRDRQNRIMRLDQYKFIDSILERFGMSDCKPVKTPLEANLKLYKSTIPLDQIDKDFQHLYQSIIGSLQYAANGTRPDIAYAVNKLAQFSVNPTDEHMKAAKHVLRYLKGTRNLVLQYSNQQGPTAFSTAEFKEPPKIQGYTDSDWAGDPNDRKSHSGYVYILSGGAISWKSRKQETIALSSVEAEYIASCAAAKHAKWLHKLFKELGLDISTIPVQVDNQGAISLQHNPIDHDRSKHIDIKYHFVREAIQENFIATNYIPTQYQSADIFTKPLGTTLHYTHLESLGLTDALSRGSIMKEGLRHTH
ncbi:hypothetical protein FRC01_003405 [Tulasnella sp. 417]|nr:hypothetical protein FRC01_003405 [Tulasnella sp. 417]